MKVTDALRVFPAISLGGEDRTVLATPTNCLESYSLEFVVFPGVQKVKNSHRQPMLCGVFYLLRLSRNANILAYLKDLSS